MSNLEAPKGGLSKYAGLDTKLAGIPPLERYPTQTVETGRSFYLQGYPAEFLVILRIGRALTRWQSEDTGSVYEFFRAPAVLGSEALVGSETYQREAVALDNCSVQYVPQGELAYLPSQVRENFLLQEAICAQKMRRLIEAGRVGKEAVVAYALLDLADKPADRDCYEISGITQETIGKIVGYSRESVSHVMTTLQAMQVIQGQKKGFWGGVLPERWILKQPDLLALIATNGIAAYKEAIQNLRA